MIPQGSEEWFAQRLGKITASRVADVMAKTKSGYGASRRNYMMQLLCERLTGEREEGFTSAAMQRGIDMEPIARAAYEVETGSVVDEAEFKVHPGYEDIGASPDGLVNNDGLIEIKCPNTAQHVDFLRTGKPDKKYWWQMQCQMACTGRDWCDYVSFDDRMPEALQMAHTRIERDEQAISEMLDECLEFLGELRTIEAEMACKMSARAMLAEIEAGNAN